MLGLVDLPPRVRRPPGHACYGEPAIRMLVRVGRDEGLALAASLRQATAIHSAHPRSRGGSEYQIDPLHIG